MIDEPTYIYVGSMEIRKKTGKRRWSTYFIEVTYDFETDTIQEKIMLEDKVLEDVRSSVIRERWIPNWQYVVQKYSAFITQNILKLRGTTE